MYDRLNLSSGDLVCLNGKYGTIMVIMGTYTLAPYLGMEGYTEEEIGRLSASYLYSSNPDEYPYFFPAKVEIGSYPSPEFSGNILYDGIDKKYANGVEGYTDISSLLYQPTIINNENFKSARCITFESFSDLNTSNVSFDYFSEKVTKFYKVKLWHQLSNGFLDLTDDVINKYNTYRLTQPITQLSEAITVGNATTINVTSTASFPSTGTIYIGKNDKFDYTSITPTSFIGNSQTLSTHNINEKVYNTSNF